MAKNDSNTLAQEVGFNLDWAKVNEWDWPDIVEPLHINITKNQKTTAATKPHDSLLLFPKVAYLYALFCEKCNTSSFDNLELGYSFPIAEADLSNVCYISKFGRRVLEGQEGWHSGIDLASCDSKEGIPIHAIAAGKVFHTESDGAAGNCVVLSHNDGMYSLYMHMQKLEKSVGDNVQKAEVIGHMGNTGHSTGPHLHFQMNTLISGSFKNGAEDPVKYFPKLNDKYDAPSLR